MTRTSHGAAVENGQVRYTSPSALTTADPSQYGGCPRRYWWKYVMGKKEPTTAAQLKGTEAVHAPIENYLKTGQKALPPMVLAGAQFIPEPGPDLLVEHPIEGSIKLSGIPIIGYIDLAHSRDHYIDTEGDVRSHGNDKVLEVIDWKSTGDLSRAKSGSDLAETVQMVSYAKWAFAVAPDADAVRLSHVYFRTKGSPASKKVTTLVRPEEIEPAWKKVEGVGKRLLDIAKQTSEDCVEANTRSCNAYGGCPHRNYCSGANRNKLDKLFGVGGAMGLLDAIKPEVRNEIEALKAAEVAVRPSPLMFSTEFAAAVASIEAAGKGFPALGGDAAKAFSQLKGRELQGQGLAGSGMLGAISVNECDAVVQVAKELAALEPAAPAAIDMPALLPPDAPASNPTATVAEKPKKARKTKDSSPVEVAANSTPSGVVGAQTTTGLVLFVDCIPSTPAASLDAYIDGLCEALCTQCGAADIRCAPADGPLGFGKWKGALAALAKESPPPAGAYSIDTRGREIAEVVADALRGKCALYVRGIR